MTRTLYLVRHARACVDPAIAPGHWPLESTALARARTLRRATVIPPAAQWYSSPERKAVETAAAMTDGSVETDSDLRECGRTWLADPDAFRTAVGRTFAAPSKAPHPGWESSAEALVRLSRALRRVLDRSDGDVVLVGHATAWTLLASDLTSTLPTLEAWMRWRMPDIRRIELSGCATRAGPTSQRCRTDESAVQE